MFGTTRTRTWRGYLACGDDKSVSLGCRRVRVTGCNGTPLPGALVELLTSANVLVKSGTTDADGYIQFDNYDVTVAKIRASRAGFNSALATGSIAAAYDTTFQLNPATGYRCCGDCPDPIVDCATATLVGPDGASVTLNRVTGSRYLGYATYIATGQPKNLHVNGRWQDPCGPDPDDVDVVIRYEWFPCQSGGDYLSVSAQINFNGNIQFNKCYELDFLLTGLGMYPFGGTAPADCGGFPPTVRLGTMSPARVSAPGCAGRNGGTWTYAANLGPRENCINGSGNIDFTGDDTDHPMSCLTGWGTAPSFSVTYSCGGGPMMGMVAPESGPSPMMGMASVASSPVDSTAGPTLAEMQANATACPHNTPIPPEERQGCGCSRKCLDGRGNMPGGGTDIGNCWACPIAPRLAD